MTTKIYEHISGQKLFFDSSEKPDLTGCTYIGTVEAEEFEEERKAKLAECSEQRMKILVKSALGETLTDSEKDALRYSLSLIDLVIDKDGASVAWPTKPV